MSELLRFLELLFIIDDIIANESLDKRRQPLLELSISGKHRDHYLWLLIQPYSAISKNLRRQAKVIFVLYPKEKGDLKMINDENDLLKDDELVVARNFLKKSKHAWLYIQNEFPRGFRLLNHIGDYFKWAFFDSFNLCLSISPFIVAISTLVEYRGSFVSRPDLFFNRKNVVAPTFETSVQRVFNGFLWFLKMSYKIFHRLPTKKQDVQKLGPVFVNLFCFA